MKQDFAKRLSAEATKLLDEYQRADKQYMDEVKSYDPELHNKCRDCGQETPVGAICVCRPMEMIREEAAAAHSWPDVVRTEKGYPADEIEHYEREWEARKLRQEYLSCKTCEAARTFDDNGKCETCGTMYGYELLDVTPPQHSPADRLAAKSSGDDSPRGADTAFHFETGKPMIDQVPPEAIVKVAEVFTYGVAKYGHFNWQHHADEWTYNQLYASCMRHLLAWQAGEDVDPESGLDHLAHATCNLMMLLTLIEQDKGKDDRGPLAQKKVFDDRFDEWSEKDWNERMCLIEDLRESKRTPPPAGCDCGGAFHCSKGEEK